MTILAIDPANIESAYVLMDKDNLKPIQFGKIKNEDLEYMIRDVFAYTVQEIAIEDIISYGMAVGASTFDTCKWIGRFYQSFKLLSGKEPVLIPRIQEKLVICGTTKANDSNIRQALIDKFGDKGTKKNKGWFYGFKKDIWQAYAVGVTYYCMKNNIERLL